MLDMAKTNAKRGLTFKNFKGGDYRAKADGGTYRLRKAAPDAWMVELQVDKDRTWSHVASGENREDAEQAANRHASTTSPAQMAHGAKQRRAVATVAALCAQRRGLTAQLGPIEEKLDEALRAAFDLGVTAGPLLEVTKQAGITTRNRLYQRRDGHR